MTVLEFVLSLRVNYLAEVAKKLFVSKSVDNSKSSRYTPPVGRSTRTDGRVSILVFHERLLIISMTVLEFVLSFRVNYFEVLAKKSFLSRSVDNSKKLIIGFSRWSQHSNWQCSFYFVFSWTVVDFSMTVLEFVLSLWVNYFVALAKKLLVSRSVDNSKKLIIAFSRWS